MDKQANDVNAPSGSNQTVASNVEQQPQGEGNVEQHQDDAKNARIPTPNKCTKHKRTESTEAIYNFNIQLEIFRGLINSEIT